MEMDSLEHLYLFTSQLTKLCVSRGIQYAVLSPGSRSAPLALAFMRNPDIKHFVINDERSAAYIALGLAEQSHAPVALVCTSGTAALNYGPAITEAYYKNIPLVAFTADRPESAQNKLENQTINQKGLFEPNVGQSLNISLADTYVNEALLLSEEILTNAQIKKQPVHINIQINEPLYHQGTIENKDFHFNRIPEKTQEPKPPLPKAFTDDLNQFSRLMLVAGIQEKFPGSKELLKEFISTTNIVFYGDITSNTHGIEKSLHFAGDITEYDQQQRDLRPEMVITFGHHLLSKKLKTFLVNNPPKVHWHIDPAGKSPDMFLAGCKNLKTTISDALNEMQQLQSRFSKDFLKKWLSLDHEIKEKQVLKSENDLEYTYISEILKRASNNSMVHLGNSLVVRLADLIPKSSIHPDIEFFSNRGTSGIDGCLSTALGAALADPDRLHITIIGDQSFLYDQNALWNNYKAPNLKIFILNNHGGKIFGRIPGPSNQPEYEEYFISYTAVSFEKIAEAHGLPYMKISNVQDLASCLGSKSFKHSKMSIIELEV